MIQDNESSRPTPPCCGNCQFGRPTPEVNKRICNRFPPTPYIVGDGRSGMSQMNVWPAVQGIDLCGEHKFRPAVSVEALRLEPSGAVSPIRKGESLGPANPEARDG